MIQLFHRFILPDTSGTYLYKSLSRMRAVGSFNRECVLLTCAIDQKRVELNTNPRRKHIAVQIPDIKDLKRPN